MLMYKTAGTGPLAAENKVDTGSKLPGSGNTDSGFSQELALEMPEPQPSEVSLQYQRKELQTTIRNDNFLGEMQEAIIMQRLGVNLEKIKQLQEKLDELEDLFEAGYLSEKDFNEKASVIEEMIAQEYQKGLERAQENGQKQEHVID
ncbi:hypothetical protein [Pseudoalteromonas ardens]|uniref:Uncharacterized protein n=1 Tax=Pseudoalteromonas rubra TaxID=43658 RepID=A0A0L0EX10_9GAMM|nr:hypothetical protein [Pseudoalteromonas sp. R96]KNC68971.1 hypothetical protein AC626_01700 [Pseudoalteromonas rubra]MDK1311074.1 hypothetical protein [Pseudoalteromonas sp. R96]